MTSYKDETDEAEEEIKNPFLRILRFTKLPSLFVMFLTWKGGTDLINGVASGSLSSLLWIPINPSLQLSQTGVPWVLIVYIMVFGWFFTNSLVRVFNGYYQLAQTWLWEPLKKRIFARFG